MKSIIRKITDAINALAILGLALSYLSPLVDPANFWPISIFGLTYPFWLTLNLLLAVLWLVTRRRRWMYNALIIVVGFEFIGRNMQINDTPDNNSELRVVSFNTNVQQVYNNGNTSTEINTLLNDRTADVAVMIEWLNKKGQVSRTNYPHQQFVRLNATHNPDDFGILLVSKHPIVHWERIIYPHHSNNLSAYFDVEVNGEVIRFVAVHLQSNFITSKDYHRMMELEGDSAYRQHALNIVSRLRKASELRSSQIDQVMEVVTDSPYPVMILGDFNDTPQSYSYQQLRNGRNDAFIERGNGWGATYRKPFNLLRIDYILYDPGFTCNYYTTSNTITSDHCILEAGFNFEHGIH